jgi:hypothetical protein
MLIKGSELRRLIREEMVKGSGLISAFEPRVQTLLYTSLLRVSPIVAKGAIPAISFDQAKKDLTALANETGAEVESSDEDITISFADGVATFEINRSGPDKSRAKIVEFFPKNSTKNLITFKGLGSAGIKGELFTGYTVIRLEPKAFGGEGFEFSTAEVSEVPSTIELTCDLVIKVKKPAVSEDEKAYTTAEFVFDPVFV